MFRNLACDLVGPETLPSELKVGPAREKRRAPWPLAPLPDEIPLRFEIPLSVADGRPSSCAAGKARIRYLLCAVAACGEPDGEAFTVRSAQEVTLVAPLDPATLPLPALPLPLVAHAALAATPAPSHDSPDPPVLDNDGAVLLTATLRRARWAAGLPLFVHVAVANCSRRPVRRLELALERTLIVLSQSSVDPDRVERKTVARRRFRTGRRRHRSAAPGAWDGIEPKKRDERIWMLQVPKGLVTVPAGTLTAQCGE